MYFGLRTGCCSEEGEDGVKGGWLLLSETAEVRLKCNVLMLAT